MTSEHGNSLLSERANNLRNKAENGSDDKQGQKKYNLDNNTNQQTPRGGVLDQQASA